ncbi:MAG: flagellar biosynthesis anti-sigma factor FlgM [Deltaproteobacteria bacterium]|nr:flagellar biosynthesis anti-sigma factor FlgM [Deltaproteobacteria bacterium]
MSMKIKGSVNKPTSAIKSSGRKGNVSAGSKAGSARGTGQSGSAKAVSVSSTDQIAAQMSSGATHRADKVAQIKLNVESGEYELDSQKTADKLIDSLTEYSLA